MPRGSSCSSRARCRARAAATWSCGLRSRFPSLWRRPPKLRPRKPERSPPSPPRRHRSLTRRRAEARHGTQNGERQRRCRHLQRARRAVRARLQRGAGAPDRGGVPGERAPGHARAEGSGGGQSLHQETMAAERHGPCPRRHDLEPAVARRRQDFSEFAGRELLAQGEPQDVPCGALLDPVAAGARGPHPGGRRLPRRAAEDQAARPEGQVDGLRWRAGHHRRDRPESAALSAQPAERRGDSRAPCQSGGAGALSQRAPDEGRGGEARGDAEMTAAKKYPAERLMTVLLAPVVSEKSTFVADKNRQYVFRVADHATKPEIKAAVELMFKTKVDSVTVSNVKGKKRRFGRVEGRRRNWKKAYVRLAAGQEINFAATE